MWGAEQNEESTQLKYFDGSLHRTECIEKLSLSLARNYYPADKLRVRFEARYGNESYIQNVISFGPPNVGTRCSELTNLANRTLLLVLYAVFNMLYYF